MTHSLEIIKSIEWLAKDLEILHQSVKQNRLDVKEEDKKQYDKRHSAVTPKFKIGDMVLLFANRIRPHSNRVITHRNYDFGPFFITDLVQGSPDIGIAYRLTHVESGKTYKRLIPSDRLKPYINDRTDLKGRLSSNLYDNSSSRVNEQVTDPATADPVRHAGKQTDNQTTQQLYPAGYDQAKRILRERVRNKQRQYFVLFADGSRSWADAVTPSLLQHYRILKERKGQRRRKQRTKRNGQGP